MTEPAHRTLSVHEWHVVGPDGLPASSTAERASSGSTAMASRASSGRVQARRVERVSVPAGRRTARCRPMTPVLAMPASPRHLLPAG